MGHGPQPPYIPNRSYPMARDMNAFLEHIQRSDRDLAAAPLSSSSAPGSGWAITLNEQLLEGPTLGKTYNWRSDAAYPAAADKAFVYPVTVLGKFGYDPSAPGDVLTPGDNYEFYFVYNLSGLFIPEETLIVLYKIRSQYYCNFYPNAEPIIEFNLTADLAISDPSGSANLNVDGTVGDEITVWNPRNPDGSYVFDGLNGAWGAAYYRASDGKYVIIQLVCPP